MKPHNSVVILVLLIFLAVNIKSHIQCTEI